MTEREMRPADDEPVEGDRDRVDRALDEAPAKGVVDERDPDPPEPNEPA
jgi:hypothetical protein